MIADASVPVVVARAIVAAALERGVGAEALAAAAGFDLDLLDDVDARAPAGTMARLWDEAGRLTGDDAFGLRVGRASPTSGMPLAGRLIAASPTLGEGLARIMAHYRVFNDVHPAEVVLDGEEVVVRVLRAPVPMPKHAIEFAFAWFVGVASLAIGEPVKLAAVSFAHTAPRDVSLHQETFGGSVVFDAEENAFRAARGLFARANAAPDPYLVELLESHAEALLAKLPPRGTFADRVRALVAEFLPRHDVSVELVAEALRVSPRTLQRKLRDEATSFSDLVDQTRCEVAKQHLRDRVRSIAEVALLAGFSDQSSFHCAFLRWTGITPGDFRRGQPRT